MVLRLFGRIISWIASHETNKPSPILVTPFWINTEVNFMQWWKTASPKLVTPPPIDRYFNSVQCAKALYPMPLILSGIITFVRARR